MNLGYVISSIIAALLLLSLVALNSRIVQGSGEQTLYAMAKIESDMIVDILKEDMRAMGYRVGDTPIVTANENRIRFLVRFEGNDNITAIDWWFNPDPNAESMVRNPNARPLYRRVSLYDPDNDDPFYDPAAVQEAELIASGVARFRLEYLDGQRIVINNPETQLDNIRQVRLDLIVESLDSYDISRFERATWVGEFTPFNLRPNTN